MPRAETIGGKFFWNLTEAVGKGKPNLIADVELVRFGYFCTLKLPFIHTRLDSPDKAFLRAALIKMSVKGGFADDLDVVIREHQRVRGGAQDGYVSVVKATGFNKTYDGVHVNIHETLMSNAAAFLGDKFPRIDCADEPGSEIKKVSRSYFDYDVKV
jgi:hypothetical protein